MLVYQRVGGIGIRCATFSDRPKTNTVLQFQQTCSLELRLLVELGALTKVGRL